MYKQKKIDSIFTILINLCFYLGYEKCQIISFLLFRSIMYPAFSLKVKCPNEMLTLCSLLANKNIFLPKFSSLRTCTHNLQEAQCRLTKNTKNKTRLLVSHEWRDLYYDFLLLSSFFTPSADVHSADSLSLSTQRDDHRVRVVVCVADLQVFKDVSMPFVICHPLER